MAGPIYTSNIDGTGPNVTGDGWVTSNEPTAYQQPAAATPTSSGTSYIQGVNDPNTLAQYDQSIGNTNSALGRLGAQQQSGYGAIDTSYQNALNQLLLGRNQGEQSYNQNKQSATSGYIGAKNTIGSQAGSTLNGLLRLLGARGAGGSSAYSQVAPGAVARQATLQRADATNTNSQNNQALDTNWGNFLTGYNNQVSGAGNQRDQSRQTLDQQIENNRAGLLQTLAQLSGQRAAAMGGSSTAAAQPFLNQANQALDRTANYTTAPINYQTQAYTAPSLASYNPQENPQAKFNNQGGNDYVSPYLQSLLGKKQQLA